MYKPIIFLVCFSIFLLAWLNKQIGYEVERKVIEANQIYDEYGHPQTYIPSDWLKVNSKLKTIFADIERFQGYRQEAERIFMFSQIFLFCSIAIFFLRRNITMDFSQWWLPFFIIIFSWLFILAVYYSFDWWSHKHFYTRMNSSAYVFTGIGFQNPGKYFKIGWYFKLLLLLLAIIIQFSNRIKGTSKFHSLFLWIAILDLTIGNIIIIFLHDDIDFINAIFKIGLNVT